MVSPAAPALIPVAVQLSRVLAAVNPLPSVTLPLDECLGLILAADVTTATDTPPFDNSAMDGYAVRQQDVAMATKDVPVRLTVIADLAAGTDMSPTVGSGCAARIMTGAPIPAGADAVVAQEDTDHGTSAVLIRRAPTGAAHIRRAGEDAHAGDTVLFAGMAMTPARIATAASAGAAALNVHRVPRVAVISTGDELVNVGTVLRHGQIPDSNSHLLAAAVREAGFTAIRIGHVPDDEDRLLAILADVAGDVDAIITSGGVSVGAYDVVKAVLEPLGVEFAGVGIQPGKPQGFGRWPGGNNPVIFALPGNPVSAFVSFEVFVRPALLRMAGARALHRHTVTATATDGWLSPIGREQYMPVVIENSATGMVAHRATRGGSASHLVSGLGHANGLAVIPASIERVEAGATVTVSLLGVDQVSCN